MDVEAWDVDHPVLALLRQRKADGTVPGNRSDAFKVGLAVEGGGMRGVVSASMLTALDDLGFSAAIDAIYACSSGAINSAYHLAGGTWYPLTIYFDDLTTPKFVDFRRAYTRRSILDIDYAFSILQDVKPLDYAYVLKSPTKLHVAVTLVDELRTSVVADFGSVDDLDQALRASSWLPVALKGATVFRGQRAVDGGVLTALPFRLAVDDSCTHILSLSTHPMSVRSENLSALNRYTRRHLNKLKPGLGDGYIEALSQKYSDQHLLERMRFSSESRDPSIFDLAPLPGTPDVKRHELDRGKVIEAARSAYEVMYVALEGEPSSSIRNGWVRAVPRFAIAERDHDDNRLIHLVDHSSGNRIPWGISRTN